MNPGRSNSVRLVSSSSISIEVELIEGSPMGSVNNTVYCCVAKGNNILYAYNSQERELERLAALCLEHTPVNHSWFFHTVGSRTFGFLMEDGYTYFAIVDPTVGNVGILWFLEQVREGFKKVTRNGYHEQLVPVIRQLIESLGRMPHSTILMDGNGAVNGETSTSNNGKPHGRRKMGEKVPRVNEEIEELREGFTGIEPVALERGLSSARLLAQQTSSKVWWRHVKIIIVANVIICLVLLSVWLAVCRGLRCLS